ncbi:hypothetical protein JXA70_05150, partial [candidate division KSB1 bacterium]|nr:hypothetical protein [candidate division KSB1 bacterium]
MPSSTIGDMFQDQLGFLWIGTKNGLVRYDGHNIVVFQHDSTNVHSIGHNFIIQICGDSQGNLWLLLGDRKGIDKYDSKTQKFYHFSHDPDNPESLDNDIVQMYMDQYDQLWIISVEKTLDKLDTTTGAIKHFSNTSSREKPNEIGDVFNLWLGYQHLIAISEDNARNLWIGTNGHGVARYNRDATSFSMYQHNPDDPQSISCDSVSFIFQDSDSILWFCTWGGGLNRYSLETNTHTHFRNDPDNPSSLGNDYCYFIYEDRFKNLWISYFGGLDCFNKENNIFTHYPGSSPNKPSFLDSWQLSFLPIYEDHEGMLWIIKTGSEYQFQLIERYDPHTGNSYIYKEDCNDPNAHRISHFTCFLQDQSGNFWMGSEYHGLTKFNPLIQSFRHYAFDAGDIHSLSHNTVNAIVESKINPGVMWLATKDGLNRYNPHLDSFARYYHDPKNPNSPSSSEFRAILADKDGLIWLGTKGGELDYYDERKKKFYHINYSPEFSQRSHIEAIFRHIDGSLWISECNRGILKYKSIDGPRERFRTEQHNSSSLCCDNILNFVQDNRGRLWLGTEKGLDRLNESGKDFSHFLPGVQILNILSDDNNCLWIGTFLMGLVRFDIVSEKITYYFNNFAPQHNFAGPITKDNSGNLWLSSMGGLTCFDPNTKQYTYYHKQHGLPTVNLLLQGTKASDGKIWVGSADNGAIVFRPEELVLNQIPPPIRIVDFRVSDKSLTIGEDSPLKCNISLADEIHLEYWQNDISIECAALHYSRPEKNQYTFWLENYDESWREAGTNRFSIYTNLDPGTYIFRAKAANSDGVWNPNPVSLQIIISPPWWRTGWAYFLWIGLFSGAVYSAYRLQLNRARLKQEVSLKIEQAQKLHELDRLKSSFFANISHELRTPLTLILGPLDSLRHETISDNIKKKLDIMQRNGIRLLQLINQLLDFSKIEAGSIRLEAAEMDLVAFVKRIVATFMSAAERKNISLEFRAEDRALLCYFDADKMDKVLANLLSNAFKFTPEYGRIDVFIHKEEPRVFIVVKDTGIGIPEDQLDHIFDRFHQVDGSHTRKAEGAGIGLALAKEMVELHHGDIYAASQPGEGSEFTVQLFLGRAHLKEEEIVKSPVNESIFAPT